MGNKQSKTSGKANYEQYLHDIPETTPSEEQRFQDKTANSFEPKDLNRYEINKPKKDTIYAIIIRHEPKKSCITSKETKTTE